MSKTEWLMPSHKSIPEVKYCYSPFVSVKGRPDGRFEVTFDWSDSYQYSHHAEMGDDYYPYAMDQGEALDKWVQSMPQTFIINSAGEMA